LRPRARLLETATLLSLPFLRSRLGDLEVLHRSWRVDAVSDEGRRGQTVDVGNGGAALAGRRCYDHGWNGWDDFRGSMCNVQLRMPWRLGMLPDFFFPRLAVGLVKGRYLPMHLFAHCIANIMEGCAPGEDVLLAGHSNLILVVPIVKSCLHIVNSWWRDKDDGDGEREGDDG
jgi:hypothetical protein